MALCGGLSEHDRARRHHRRAAQPRGWRRSAGGAFRRIALPDACRPHARGEARHDARRDRGRDRRRAAARAHLYLQLHARRGLRAGPLEEHRRRLRRLGAQPASQPPHARSDLLDGRARRPLTGLGAAPVRRRRQRLLRPRQHLRLPPRRRRAAVVLRRRGDRQHVRAPPRAGARRPVSLLQGLPRLGHRRRPRDADDRALLRARPRVRRRRDVRPARRGDARGRRVVVGSAGARAGADAGARVGGRAARARAELAANPDYLLVRGHRSALDAGAAR